ncbi:MAG: AMP-binding protein [Acidimicrobiia bacterium]
MAQRAIDPRPEDYRQARDQFRWRIPSTFNMGVACSDAVEPDSIALLIDEGTGRTDALTFGELSARSSGIARSLSEMGIQRGDRVGVVAPQSLETGLAHLALWKMGAISLPLASLFGPEALSYRLGDADAALAIVSPDNRDKVAGALPDLPLVSTDESPFTSGTPSSTAFSPVVTEADDPAYLIYTSGTTGSPKGALHAHRSLFGHLPGFELYYEYAPRPGDVIWTPADWAWIGGLMDVLVPAWYHGMSVLTTVADFEPNRAVELMVRHGVTAAFLPPTALKLMRAAGVDGTGLKLRAVFTGGEPLGEEIQRWSVEVLGCPINEGYGQTECNLVVGNCASTWPVKPGSMGRALPGHEVAVLDEAGERVVDEAGEICVRRPDPVMMLGYWNRPRATADKYRGDWLATGDLGIEDQDGYFWFRSRADDVINSRGYRIGPGEIEESLMRHPAVALCGVRGVDDELRGQVPVAWVVLRAGHRPSPGLVETLRDHVRNRLAGHEVPARIHFVDDLPRTTTGKLKRRSLVEPDPR